HRLTTEWLTIEILRADVAEAETSQVVRPAQIKSVENRDIGNGFRNGFSSLELTTWGTDKNRLTVVIKDVAKKARDVLGFRAVPYVDRGYLDIAQQDQISGEPDVFGCFDVKSVNLHVSTQWASGNVRRDRNSLALSG